MVELRIKLPEGFLEDEVRDGHLVPRKMKEVWAVELDLLEEAKRVLEKHNLRYMVIGGTLLGAVRHKGFIPWDDDIDIAIPRQDYLKFRKIAAKEFRHPYFFQDEFNSPGLLCGHAKLRNSETTNVYSEFIFQQKTGKLSFNLGIFIDFFPIDNLPDDSKERTAWFSRIQRVASKAWSLRVFTHRGRTAGGNIGKHKRQDFILTKILHCPNLLFKKYDRLLSKYSNKRTKEVCLYCVHCRDHSGKNRFVYQRKDLQSLIWMPFEFIEVPAPANYDAVLTQCYGNWHVRVKADSEHGNPDTSFYDVDNSYLCYFKEGYLDMPTIKAQVKQVKNNSIDNQ